MKNFYDDEHADNRLRDCFVIVEGEYENKCHLVVRAKKNDIYFRDGYVVEGYPKNDKVHVTLPRLGYVNSNTMASYVTRSPKRMWKAGYTNGNTMMVTCGEGLFASEINLGAALLKLFEGRYPTFDEALRSVGGGTKLSCAFSPDFAISVVDFCKAPVLYYKTKIVGYFNDDAIYMGDPCQHIAIMLKEFTDYKVVI